MSLYEDPQATEMLARYAAANNCEELRALLMERNGFSITPETSSGEVYAAALGIMQLYAQVITRTGHYASLTPQPSPDAQDIYRQGYAQALTDNGLTPRA